jgi:hypothetical protein
MAAKWLGGWICHWAFLRTYFSLVVDHPPDDRVNISLPMHPQQVRYVCSRLTLWISIYIHTSESCPDDSDPTVCIFRLWAPEEETHHHPHGCKGFPAEAFALVSAIPCKCFPVPGRRRPRRREERLAEEPLGPDRASHGFRRHVQLQGVSCSCGTKGNLGNSKHMRLLVSGGAVCLSLFCLDLDELSRPWRWRCPCTAMAAQGRSRSKWRSCKVGTGAENTALALLLNPGRSCSRAPSVLVCALCST